MLVFFSVKLRRFGGPFDSLALLGRSGQADSEAKREPPAETLSLSNRPAIRLKLTLMEGSCYSLKVPRVKVGLPVCVRFRR